MHCSAQHRCIITATGLLVHSAMHMLGCNVSTCSDQVITSCKWHRLSTITTTTMHVKFSDYFQIHMKESSYIPRSTFHWQCSGIMLGNNLRNKYDLTYHHGQIWTYDNHRSPAPRVWHYDQLIQWQAACYLLRCQVTEQATCVHRVRERTVEETKQHTVFFLTSVGKTQNKITNMKYQSLALH